MYIHTEDYKDYQVYKCVRGRERDDSEAKEIKYKYAPVHSTKDTELVSKLSHSAFPRHSECIFHVSR